MRLLSIPYASARRTSLTYKDHLVRVAFKIGTRKSATRALPVGFVTRTERRLFSEPSSLVLMQEPK